MLSVQRAQLKGRQEMAIYKGKMMGVLALAVLVAALAAAGTAGAASTSHGGGGGGNVTYRVNGDTIVHKRNAVKPAHARLWQRFVTLIPAEQRTELRKFIVFKGGFSDAFVGPLRRDPKLWELGVNRSLLGDRELDVVLLHEFGHLLTLTADQIPPGSRGRRCGTYRTDEGCANPQSYIAQYVDELWRPNGTLADWRRFQRIRNERRYERAERKFFRNHRGEFLTRYSATNPAEDMAEAFASFALRDIPKREGVAGAKHRFFERFPELMQLRDEIRARRAA